jgi:hypothetical protein
MVPEQAVDLINSHDHDNTTTPVLGNPVNTGSLVGKAVTEPKIADLAISNRTIQPGAVALNNLDYSTQALITAGSSGGVPGLTNFIAEGLDFAPGTGLNITVNKGRASISEQTVTLTAAQTFSLDARMAALFYLQKNGTVGKINAAIPEPDDHTIGQWRFNQTGAGAVIPNYAINKSAIAVANDLIPSGGLASVDGHTDYAIKGDGSTGYYTSANSTGFPIGAAERQIDMLYTPLDSSGEKHFLNYGGSSSTTVISGIDTTGTRIKLNNNGYDTNYDIEVGKTYLFSSCYDGTNIIFYVNGRLAYKVAATLATAATVLSVLRWYAAGGYNASGIIHYIEIRNKMRTSAQIAQISNALLLPCTYQTPYVTENINGITLYDIATSENAISGGDFTGYYKSSAFNKDDLTTMWYSLQQTSSLSGIAYIGQKLSSNIKHIKYTNSGILAANITSIKMQWSYDLATWNDIQTQTLLSTANLVTDFDVTSYSATGIHYVRVLANANIVTAGQSWGLCEIRMYTDVKPDTSKDIRALPPTDSISLGRVLTTSLLIKDINLDHQMGRVEKAVKGNRRKFLGWKPFSGAQLLNWTNNPFSTRKFEIYVVWAQDANGTNESDAFVGYSGAANEGVLFEETASQRIQVSVQSAGAVVFNGAWQTSGFIGVYVEVID